jgi:hypothetical protein
MTYLDKNTFGKTPAANYLVRELNTISDRHMIRSCTIKINNFNENVDHISASVVGGYMSAKSAANLCRLLRFEATQVYVQPDFGGFSVINNLVQNVIIGKIKSLTRRLSVLRKIETGSVNEDKIKSHGSRVRPMTDEDSNPHASIYTICGYPAAVIYDDDPEIHRFYRTIPELTDITDEITTETLHKRSFIKCRKQGKDWTMNYYDFTEIMKVMPFRN